jgi:hypothetical protein
MCRSLYHVLILIPVLVTASLTDLTDDGDDGPVEALELPCDVLCEIFQRTGGARTAIQYGSCSRSARRQLDQILPVILPPLLLQSYAAHPDLPHLVRYVCLHWPGLLSGITAQQVVALNDRLMRVGLAADEQSALFDLIEAVVDDDLLVAGLKRLVPIAPQPRFRSRIECSEAALARLAATGVPESVRQKLIDAGGAVLVLYLFQDADCDGLLAKPDVVAALICCGILIRYVPFPEPDRGRSDTTTRYIPALDLTIMER